MEMDSYIYNRFDEAIEKKRKLLSGSLECSALGRGATINTFKPIANENVTILKFSEDGNSVCTNEAIINIGGAIGKGQLRTAFQLSIDNNDSFVIKISNPLQLPMSFIDIINDNLTMELASLYAKEFNSLNPPKLISINQPFIIFFHERTPTVLAQGEALLKGEYIKYNNNGTFVNEIIKRNTPQAFSHFTLEVSNGSHVITDVQGVGDTYTDLQVHSISDKYGKGNQKLMGIVKFSQSHKCNQVCSLLELPNSKISDTFGETEISYMDIQSIDIDSKMLEGKNYLEAGLQYLLKKDYQNAIENFKKASNFDNSDALFNLGLIYHYGKESIPSEIDKAIEYYKKSADLGNSNAKNNLGSIYKDDKDPTPTLVNASFWKSLNSSSLYINNSSDHDLLIILEGTSNDQMIKSMNFDLNGKMLIPNTVTPKRFRLATQFVYKKTPSTKIRMPSRECTYSLGIIMDANHIKLVNHNSLVKPGDTVNILKRHIYCTSLGDFTSISDLEVYLNKK